MPGSGNEADELGRPIKVLVVDDHQAFGEALHLALGFEDDLESVGAVTSVEDAIPACERATPDVVLMDIDLPGADGIEGTRMVKTRFPDVQVLLLTGYTDPALVERGASAGASGFLPKQTPIAEVLRAVRTASEGEMLVPASMLSALVGGARSRPSRMEGAARLTDRELEVLTLLGRGLDARGIAKRLNIQLSTCRGHIKGILRKLDAHSQLEAVVEATRRGYLTPVEGA